MSCYVLLYQVIVQVYFLVHVICILNVKQSWFALKSVRAKKRVVQAVSPYARCYLLRVQLCLSAGVGDTNSCTETLSVDLFISVGHGKYVWMRICAILRGTHKA